jgi:hypothetical protein
MEQSSRPPKYPKLSLLILSISLLSLSFSPLMFSFYLASMLLKIFKLSNAPILKVQIYSLAHCFKMDEGHMSMENIQNNLY